MPELYVTFARKIFSQNLWRWGARDRRPSVSCAYFQLSLCPFDTCVGSSGIEKQTTAYNAYSNKKAQL